jgi:hypothetical protein
MILRRRFPAQKTRQFVSEKWWLEAGYFSKSQSGIKGKNCQRNF